MLESCLLVSLASASNKHFIWLEFLGKNSIITTKKDDTETHFHATGPFSYVTGPESMCSNFPLQRRYWLSSEKTQFNSKIQ